MKSTDKQNSSQGDNVAPEKPYFDRAVSLEKEKEKIAEDLKQVYAEAKEDDIDTKALRLAVKRCLESDHKRLQREATEAEASRILEALGEFVTTPLGEAAAKIAKGIRSGEMDIKIGDQWMSERLRP